MTFPIVGSECAPGIFDLQPAVAPDGASLNAAEFDIVRPFVRDRMPEGTRLACHWHREVDGRLACIWEPDIVPIPPR